MLIYQHDPVEKMPAVRCSRSKGTSLIFQEDVAESLVCEEFLNRDSPGNVDAPIRQHKLSISSPLLSSSSSLLLLYPGFDLYHFLQQHHSPTAAIPFNSLFPGMIVSYSYFFSFTLNFLSVFFLNGFTSVVIQPRQRLVQRLPLTL